MNNYSVSVKVTYWIRGDKQQKISQCFDGSNVQHLRLGLPLGLQPTKVSISS
jgi:hypothetical protein